MRFLPPNDTEIKTFKDQELWADRGLSVLRFWLRQTPDLAGPDRIKQLDATLSTFNLLCRRLDQLKV